MTTPLKQSQPTETSTERPQAYILVVDDEELLVEAMKEIFAKDGCRVETASNGVEGLNKFQRNRFDIIFSDHSMPEMNGMELAEQVKLMSPKTPFIMVTAYAHLLRKKQGEHKNIDLIVDKPFEPQALLDALQKYLS